MARLATPVLMSRYATSDARRIPGSIPPPNASEPTAAQTGIGAELVTLLGARDLWLLRDRRVPEPGRANIDHVAVGPAGVLVIQLAVHAGRILAERSGGLFTAPEPVLTIDGRDQTHLIDVVERQVSHIQDALEALPGLPIVEVRGALCAPTAAVSAPRQLGGILVGDVHAIVTLAARPGPLGSDHVNAIWEHLGRRFPPT